MNLERHIQNVVRRSKSFYNKTESGHFLVNTKIASESSEIPPFYQFNFDAELEKLLEYELESAKSSWAVKEGIDDDSVPAIAPYFGIAEHSAWLGLDAVIQENTSLSIPVVNSIDDLNKLSCSESNKWFQYMKRSYDYFRSRKDGSFVLSVRGIMTPMDIANAVCGDKLFEDFLLEPEYCHKLMEYFTKVIRWYYPHVLSWSDSIENGYIFNCGGGWMPKESIGHLSNDTAMLCSGRLYKKFGLPYEKQMVDGYSNILYHVHNEKIHYFSELVKLPNLSMLQVSYDPKTVKPINNLEEIYKVTDNTNLMLDATCEEVVNNIEMLKQRNVFLQVNCKNKSDAVDIVKFIRDRSKRIILIFCGVLST
jgi:hypothetical protein